MEDLKLKYEEMAHGIARKGQGVQSVVAVEYQLAIY